MKMNRVNCLAAAAKAEAWANTARGGGRYADAELLDLMALSCRDCAEAESDGVNAGADKTDVNAPRCSLCGNAGIRCGMGWSCSNTHCIRFGRMVPRGIFAGCPETAQIST